MTWRQTTDGRHRKKNIEDEYISRETAVLLAKLIRQLDYPYRQVICLQYYNGMKTREIAEVMNLSRENVKKISNQIKNCFTRPSA